MEVQLVGQKIKTIRKATKKELASEGWDERDIVMIIVLENGNKLYPSRDYEGNGGGALFGQTKQGRQFGL